MALRVRELREKRGWSVRKLAERAGLAFSAVHRLESGKTAPRLTTLEALAAALGVTVPELFVTEPKRKGRAGR